MRTVGSRQSLGGLKYKINNNMEKVTNFFVENAVAVEVVLAVVVLILGKVTWKFRQVAIKAAEALKDGKISREEADVIADELLEAVYGPKQ
jgi:hypothetical protein